MLNAYRLHPDRRFLLAVAQIHSFLSGKKTEEPEVSFQNGHWTIRYAGADAGSLSELPDFDEFLETGSKWARYLGKQYPLHLATVSNSDPSIEKNLGNFLLPAPLRALYQIEKQWTREKDGSLLYSAARAYSYLSVQQSDKMEIADAVPAKALAMLILAKTFTSYDTTESECLLGYAMGYTGFAEKKSAALTPTDIVRLFIAQDESLRTAATAKDASNKARYLYLAAVSKQNDPELWFRTGRQLFPRGRTLALMKTGLDVIAPVQVEAMDMSSITEDVPVEARKDLEAEKKTVESDAIHFFFDMELLSSFYQGYIYSAYFVTEDAPAGAGDSLGSEYNQWKEDYNLASKLNPPVAIIARDVEGLHKLGGSPILQTLKKFLEGIPSDNQQAFIAIRLIFQRLDTRVLHRANLLDIALYNLRDRNLTQRLSESLLKAASDENALEKAKSAIFLGRFSDVSDLLGSTQCQAESASRILEYWNWADKSNAQRIEYGYDQLVAKHPDSWDITTTYVDFLREKRDYKKACSVTQTWLDRNNDPDHVGFTHAHIRQSYNYYMAGEFQKGLAVLTPVSDFWAADRQKALLLNGLGRKEEAEDLARRYVERHPGDIDGRGILVMVYWKNGKYDEAADVLQKHPVSNPEFYEGVTQPFFDTFQNATILEIKKAIMSLRAHHMPLWGLQSLPDPFARAGKPEVAFEIASSIQPGASAHETSLIDAYQYLKAYKGKEEASRWLQTLIPPNRRNPLSVKFLYTNNRELLWELIQEPDPKDHPDDVWFFRAVAFALDGSKDGHRQEVLQYFRQPKQDTRHRMGQYLVGLIDEKELVSLATNASERCSISYCIAAKAQGEGRYLEASDYYRVAIETGVRQTDTWHLSYRTLTDWPNLGLWRIQP